MAKFLAVVLDDNDANEQLEALERKEGLEYLLGGLDIGLVSSHAWEKESVDSCSLDEDSKTTTEKPPQPALVIESMMDQSRPHSSPTLAAPQIHHHQHLEDPLEQQVAFQNAYTCSGYCTPHGKTESPPVQIMLDHHRGGGGCGKTLVATRKVVKGQTVYTERAAVATQLPCKHAKQVRACQYCFRSLEPASSAVMVSSEGEGGGDAGNNKGDGVESPPRTLPTLPEPHLWPVPEMDFSECNALPRETVIEVDKFQRLHCMECHAWFCNEYCLRSHEEQVGDHCLCQKALWLLTTTRMSAEDDDPVQEEESFEVQAPVALATRMFAMAIHKYRTSTTLADGCWRGLCGTAADVTPLELGFPVANNNNNDDDEKHNRHQTFTLKPLHDRLVQLYSLSEAEQNVLSLDLFETFCAMAARNGIGMRTQSPFSSYYNALIRWAGGRGTTRHETLKQQVAEALGSTSGNLERGMDRTLDNRVAPELVALFPLTARINHSCFYGDNGSSNNNNNNNNSQCSSSETVNAEVTSQVFRDCHMDLVATLDIFPGDELRISYLGRRAVERKRTEQRKRELQAKYLFECQCPKCCTQGTTHDKQQQNGSNESPILITSATEK